MYCTDPLAFRMNSIVACVVVELDFADDDDEPIAQEQEKSAAPDCWSDANETGRIPSPSTASYAESPARMRYLGTFVVVYHTRVSA